MACNLAIAASSQSYLSSAAGRHRDDPHLCLVVRVALLKRHIVWAEPLTEHAAGVKVSEGCLDDVFKFLVLFPIIEWCSNWLSCFDNWGWSSCARAIGDKRMHAKTVELNRDKIVDDTIEKRGTILTLSCPSSFL